MDECSELVVGLSKRIFDLLLPGNIEPDADDLTRSAVRILLEHRVVEEPAIGPIDNLPAIFDMHGASLSESLKCEQDPLTIDWMDTRNPEVRILQKNGAGKTADYVNIIAHPKRLKIP